MFLFPQSEKIAFIMDESNVLDSSFLERMNTLLANGEVPGLFEGDEYTTLMTQCKEGSQRAGLMLDSSEELYKWFTQEVIFKDIKLSSNRVTTHYDSLQGSYWADQRTVIIR